MITRIRVEGHAKNKQLLETELNEVTRISIVSTGTSRDDWVQTQDVVTKSARGYEGRMSFIFKGESSEQ